MNFWQTYLEIWYWGYLVAVPVALYFLKDTKHPWERPISLCLLVFLLPVLVLLLDYARQQAIEGYNGSNFDCWVYDLYFFCLFAMVSIIYVGWWELGNRAFRKQLSWSIKGNLRFGVVSSAIVFLSLILPLYWPLIGFAFLSYREDVYFKIIPLFC